MGNGRDHRGRYPGRAAPAALRAALLSGAVVCALSAARGSAAGTDPGDAVAVMLAFDSQREAGERLAAALEAQLAGAGTALAVEWAKAPAPELKGQLDAARRASLARGAVSVFWYVEVSGSEGLLCIADAESARLLVRRLAWSPGEARAETIAVIVSSAIGVIRRGGTIGVAEPQLEPEPGPSADGPAAPPAPNGAPAPTAAPAPPPAPSRRFVLGLEAAGAYQARSEPVPAMFGFDAGVSVMPLEWLALRAGFTLWNRATVEGELADIELRRIPYRIGAAYATRLGGFGFAGGASVVLDDVRQRTVEIHTGDPLAVGRSNRDLVVSLLPEIAADFSVVARLSFSLSIGLEIPVNRVSYRYYGSARSERIEAAWAVQPRVGLGARVWLF